MTTSDPRPSTERIEAARNRYELAVEANERGPAQDVDAQWQALVEETSAAWAELEAAVRESYAPLVAAARRASLTVVIYGQHLRDDEMVAGIPMHHWRALHEMAAALAALPGEDAGAL